MSWWTEIVCRSCNCFAYTQIHLLSTGLPHASFAICPDQQRTQITPVCRWRQRKDIGTKDKRWEFKASLAVWDVCLSWADWTHGTLCTQRPGCSRATSVADVLQPFVRELWTSVCLSCSAFGNGKISGHTQEKTYRFDRPDKQKARRWNCKLLSPAT